MQRDIPIEGKPQAHRCSQNQDIHQTKHTFLIGLKIYQEYLLFRKE
jgi:hypothetical protein